MPLHFRDTSMRWPSNTAIGLPKKVHRLDTGPRIGTNPITILVHGLIWGQHTECRYTVLYSDSILSVGMVRDSILVRDLCSKIRPILLGMGRYSKLFNRSEIVAGWIGCGWRLGSCGT